MAFLAINGKRCHYWKITTFAIVYLTSLPIFSVVGYSQNLSLFLLSSSNDSKLYINFQFSFPLDTMTLINWKDWGHLWSEPWHGPGGSFLMWLLLNPPNLIHSPPPSGIPTNQTLPLFFAPPSLWFLFVNFAQLPPQQLIQALFETGKSNFSSEFEVQKGYLDNDFFSIKQHFKRKQNVKPPRWWLGV